MQDVTVCMVGIPKILEIVITNTSEKYVLVAPKLAENQTSNSKMKLRIPEEPECIKYGEFHTIQVIENNI